MLLLEAQLEELDRMGAHLAAAHVDAAIIQVSRDIQVAIRSSN